LFIDHSESEFDNIQNKEKEHIYELNQKKSPRKKGKSDELKRKTN
jgi:hypothetical protein